MSQGIHTCSSSDKRRQTQSNFRVKDCITRDQRKVIDRIFVSGICICNNGSESSFTSCTSSSWNCDEKRKFFVYFQNSLHLSQGLFRFYCTRTDSLCTVHTGTAAETDDHITSVFMIEVQCFLYIYSCRIGNCFIIYGVRNPCFLQSLFQTSGKSEFSDACICNDQYVCTFVTHNDLGKFFDTSCDFRFTVR